jgi:hypothetical protein
MTASDWVIIIAAIGLALVQVITAWKASAKVDIVASKLEDQRAGNSKMVQDISEIHTNTNGNLTKLTARLEKLEKALAAKTAELEETKTKT